MQLATLPRLTNLPPLAQSGRSPLVPPQGIACSGLSEPLLRSIAQSSEAVGPTAGHCMQRTFRAIATTNSPVKAKPIGPTAGGEVKNLRALDKKLDTMTFCVVFLVQNGYCYWNKNWGHEKRFPNQQAARSV
jgi:hypothetical protein